MPGRVLPDLNEDLGAAASQLLSQTIQINTVNPPGDERPLAELLVAVARREGLEARVVETPSQGSKRGRAAAWARLPGTGKRAPVVLLSHLDVVPAEPSGWAVDPFGGLVAGGYVVGRYSVSGDLFWREAISQRSPWILTRFPTLKCSGSVFSAVGLNGLTASNG
jgi:acetylornithine deacetylase/succinyl-diaminopimelate desuccinylase-like protein